MEMSGQVQGPALLSFGKRPFVPTYWVGGRLESSLSGELGEYKNRISLPPKETRYLGPILYIVSKSLCVCECVCVCVCVCV